MATMTEIEALKAIIKILSGIEEPAARNRILKWAWDKFATEAIPASEKKRTSKPKKKGLKKKATKKKTKGIVDMDL